MGLAVFTLNSLLQNIHQAKSRGMSAECHPGPCVSSEHLTENEKCGKEHRWISHRQICVSLEAIRLLSLLMN